MSATMNVTVNPRWAVYLNGEQVVAGRTVEVDRATGEHWLSRGWATAADTTPQPAATAEPAKTRRPTTGRQRRP